MNINVRARLQIVQKQKVKAGDGALNLVMFQLHKQRPGSNNFHKSRKSINPFHPIPTEPTPRGAAVLPRALPCKPPHPGLWGWAELTGVCALRGFGMGGDALSASLPGPKAGSTPPALPGPLPKSHVHNKDSAERREADELSALSANYRP